MDGNRQLHAGQPGLARAQRSLAGLLADGRALALGVRGAGPSAAMGEVYNPATGTWSQTSSPGLLRFQGEVVQLPDGRILVAGGETEQVPPPVPHVLGVVKWCDLYDPANNAWRRVADLNWFREYHAVTLLVPDGRVVTTGGTRIKFQYGPTSADIEAYSPPYLFRGVRPQIQQLSTTRPRRGEVVSLEIFPQTQLTSAVLMGAQSTTHWVDGGVPRRIILPVTQNGSAVTFTLPTDANLVPLGRYLLFAMVDDIPSVALMVELLPRIGDVDGDGTVGILDFLALLAAWGPCPAPPAACPADVDGDGSAGIVDLLGLLGNWG